MKTKHDPSAEKTLACETCSMRKQAEANPKSFMARLWRWHTGWITDRLKVQYMVHLGMTG